MTVVSVLLGAAVEVGMGFENLPWPSKKYIFISLSYINFSDVLVSEMILGWNIC